MFHTSRKHKEITFTIEFDRFDRLPHSFTVNEDKLQNLSIFKISAKVRVSDSDQNLQMINLLNSLPFIIKTHVNHVYYRILSFWLTFTVLQSIKANLKFSQFSRFLLRSGYTILVKYLKMSKTSLICSINQENTRKSCLQLNLIVLTDCHTVSQWMKINFKICQYSRFLLRSRFAVLVKIWQWLKLLNSIPYIKKTLVNHVYYRILSFWLTVTVLQSIKANLKFSQFSKFLLRSGYTILVKYLKMTKTSLFCSIHQENISKLCLQSNLVVLTHFHSFRVNKDKLQN